MTTARRGSRARPAPYAIHVVAEGFRAEPARVALEPGTTAHALVALRLSGLTDSVVVSASQVETPLATLGASATVLTEADLAARQAETVVDGLRFVPGMTISATGGRGTVTSVFPRGGESDYTLVLVDGLRQNAFGGAFDFGHLALADVERVEVVRGPQSALFGSDAIGAVVHVVTRRPAGPRASGLVEGGSFGTLRATAAASGSRRGSGGAGRSIACSRTATPDPPRRTAKRCRTTTTRGPICPPPPPTARHATTCASRPGARRTNAGIPARLVATRTARSPASIGSRAARTRGRRSRPAGPPAGRGARA